MTRLEKKCFLASAALHGLLVVVLLFGAAFLGPPKEKPLLNRINVIPSIVVENALAGGGGNPNLARTDEQVKGNSVNPADASPAPIPTPAKPPVVHARETPPPPQPRPQPTLRPEPVKPEPAKTPVARPPDNPKPNPTEKTPTPTQPTLDLVPSVRTDPAKIKAEAQAREAAKQRADYNRLLATKLGEVTSGLKAGFEGGTKVDVGGPGGQAYANYATIVQAAYDAAWRVLPDLASSDHVVTVEVVIGRSGRIISQHIVSRSSNMRMDKSVQSAIDRVKEQGLPPFPQGARDDERTFTIEFNLKARRLAG
jgi:TonB family protein